MKREEMGAFVDGLGTEQRAMLGEVLRDASRGITAEDRRMFLSGDKIGAIRGWRLRTGLGLQEASAAFEAADLPFGMRVGRVEVRCEIPRQQALTEGLQAVLSQARQAYVQLTEETDIDDAVTLVLSTRRAKVSDVARD